MKLIYRVVLFAFFLPSALYSQTQAVRSYDVYDSVGVNTHWSYGSPYQYLNDFSQLIDILKQAHIVHYRDGELWHGYDTPSWMTSMYEQLQAAGLKGELIVSQGQSVDQLESGLKLYPGVEAIESMNEWDWNGGSGWVNSMLPYLPVIKQAGSDLGLPVIGPSLTQESSFSRLGNVAQYMDYDNMHPYNDGRNPETTGWGGGVDAEGNGFGSIEWNLDMVHEYGPNLPAYATEAGYQTTSTPTQGQVPEEVAATYVPRMVLDFFKHGVTRTYFYELIDDPPGVQPGFGLLHYDMSPKPSFTAITNLLQIFADSNTQFTPAPLNYSLTGDMSGVETLLVQKSNGDYYLNVWLNGSIYDAQSLVATPQTPHTLQLSLPSGKAVTYVASFAPDGTIAESTPNQSTYAVNANSCVTVIRISDVAPAAVANYSVSIAPAALTVKSGQSSAVTLTVNAENGFDSPVAFSCSGLPAGATCGFSPSNVTPSNSAASTTLTVAYAAQSAAGGHGPLPWLPIPAAAALFGLFGRKRLTRLMLVLFAASVMGMTMLSGCSGGNSSSSSITPKAPTPTTPTPTPTATNSTVTVTATAGTMQRSTTFSLTVQ